MLRSLLAAAVALFAILLAASTSRAANSTEGIVVYSPLDGVTVVTVSTDLEQEGGATDRVPAVNVINQVNVVNVVARRSFSLRCGIGVLYPWERKFCGDPLYPF